MLTAVMLFSLLPASGAGSLDYAYAAPGGSVGSIDELIEAFGFDDFGKPNAQPINGSDTEIRLLNNVIMQSPIVITNGNYRIVGGGCTIARGFDAGSLIVLDGSDLNNSPSLELERAYGSEYGEADEANIILDGNSAAHPDADGALISVVGKAKLTMNSRVLLRNAVSSGNGGALSVTATVNGESAYYPEVKIFACRFVGCSADNGGAVYFNVSSPSVDADKRGGNLSIEKSFFSGCNAAADGGALYTLGGRTVISETSFKENKALRGGGAFICSEAELKVISMDDNTASASGGGIFCGKDEASGEICEMSIINIMALGNHSDDNGGLIANYGIVVVSSFYSDGNTASGCGGSIYNAGSFAYTDGSIINCKSEKLGGAVYSTSGSVFIMRGGEINSNTALYGGAIYSEGYFEMSGGAVGKNRGGIPEVIFKGETAMSGSAVVSNKNVIGLCIYKNAEGKEIIPVIKLKGELTNKAIQKAAFYRENSENGIYSYDPANSAGMKLFEGEAAFIASAVKVFDIEGSFFKSYDVGKDGCLYYKFPLMPVWAWILTLTGLCAASFAVIWIIKKKRCRTKA